MGVIRFYAKEVYGNTLFYAVDFQKEIEALTGQKTLTAKTMTALENLGFQLIEVLDSRKGGEA